VVGAEEYVVLVIGHVRDIPPTRSAKLIILRERRAHQSEAPLT
jgi:hypothetical protein